MNPLSPLYRLLLELAVAAAALIGVSLYWHHAGAVHGRAEVQQKWDAERAAQTRAVLAASEAARAVELKRVAAQEEIDREATKFNERAAMERATADAAGVSLQRRFASLASRGAAPGGAAPVGPGAPASAPDVVLTNVFKRIDDAAGELAAYADRLVISGAACAESYDTLRTKGN